MLAFLRRRNKPATVHAPRPVIEGVDGAGELILSGSRPVYQFERLEDVSDVTKARDDELVAALMALETCDVCLHPMNICTGHFPRLLNNDEDHDSICDHCGETMPLSQSRTCYMCGMVTCLEHEAPIDHACQGEDPE